MSAPAQETAAPKATQARPSRAQGPTITPSRAPKLPGTTLGVRLAAGAQPVSNPKNVIGEAVSPDCPFLTQTLNELMAFARVNYVNLYRLALAQRRAGASQDVVRTSLVENLCLAENAGN